MNRKFTLKVVTTDTIGGSTRTKTEYVIQIKKGRYSKARMIDNAALFSEEGRDVYLLKRKKPVNEVWIFEEVLIFRQINDMTFL